VEATRQPLVSTSHPHMIMKHVIVTLTTLPKLHGNSLRDGALSIAVRFDPVDFSAAHAPAKTLSPNILST
jgi:hypothetical protein